jgi:hypothetical protein
MRLCMLFMVILLAVPFGAVAASDGAAKGSLSYKGTTVMLKHAYLIKGPEAVDPSRIIRLLILSRDDLRAAILACKTMSCVDGELTAGIQVDFDAGPRLNYWVALNGGRLQYSGSARPSVAQVAGDGAQRLAGTLSIDDTVADGPRVEVEFTATVLKQFTTAR